MALIIRLARPVETSVMSTLPKVSAEDVSVHFTKGVLTVVARVEIDVFQRLTKVVVADRGREAGEKYPDLPSETGPARAGTAFENGVLKVVIGELPLAD